MTGPQDGAANNSLLRASAEGIKFLVLLQICSRLLTFIVNQVLLQYLSPELLGVSVQFELYMITILYFSRESLRTAVQRYGNPSSSAIPSKDKEKGKGSGTASGWLLDGTPAARAQTVVNLAYIPIPLGLLFAAIIAPYYTKSFASASRSYFHESVVLYTMAIFVELLSETGFAISQQLLLYKLRAAAESTAALVRCILTCGLTIYAARSGFGGDHGLGPLPFAVGQLGYALVLAAIYTGKCWTIASQDGFSLGLKGIESVEGSYYFNYFHKPLSSLAFSMWIQSAVKHFLTQGDSILIAWLATAYDQGIYALASNYGSLIARMLFQPLEESSRNLFAKILFQSDERGKETKVDSASLRSAIAILQNILRLYTILSIFFFSLGPPLAPLLLRIVAGSRWSGAEAGLVLSSFCYYIPLLAVNGITEAFVQSAASSKELRLQSIWMFTFTVGFGMAGYVFLRVLGWGAQGLVWANAVNMGLRIVWSWWFINGYCKRNATESISVMAILPDSKLIGAAAVVGTALRRMQDLDRLSLVVIGKVGALGILLVAACALTEYAYFIECYRMIKSGRSSPDTTRKNEEVGAKS